ncbi:MAG: DNA ligase D, partial [Acidobacteriota bacterium]|nr:DNA ligase D [Acidobacteriota bacterium]
MATRKTAKGSAALEAVEMKAPAKASAAVDEQLARYRSMRDFHVTAEPSGKAETERAAKASGQGLPFVIQKHAASHLHYDFRLGWNGVLKSWAVAKGPSYYTGDRRLAVQVEDHPIEYGGFEGIIPQGEYGGGTVMVWDQGTWEPQPGHTDVEEGLRKGSLKFIMHGTKIKGRWTLVRMGGKAANERKPNWLLIKEHDEFERGSEDPCITVEAPNSVVTGRSLEQIAHSEDHVWNSKQTAKGNAWYRQDAKTAGAEEAQAGARGGAKKAGSSKPASKGKASGSLKGVGVGAKVVDRNIEESVHEAPTEKIPDFIAPELALLSSTPPGGDGWLHELKLDGYRVQARKDGDRVQLLTRTGLDWTHRMTTIADEVRALRVKQALLDGEVVVLAEDGTTSFADLQAAFQEGVKKPLTYFIFDLLHCEGHNLRVWPLSKRKEVLGSVLKEPGEFLRYSEHLETSGEAMFQKACDLHAEGIISKRAGSAYTSGRSGNWLKLKCIHEQEFVVGGFTLPSDGSHGIGALLLGFYDGKKLVYAGRAGTGYTQKMRGMLRAQLEKLRQPESAFSNAPAEAKRGAFWVEPRLVAQVNFATWTADNLLRQASFKGLREDKPAEQVGREEPGVAPKRRGTKKASHASASGPAAKAVKKTADRKVEPAPVRLTHPEKILDVETKLTKQQLADYYWAVAPHMLPHIQGRPLSLVRCPEGSGKPCFFQKHVNHMLPPGIASVDVADKHGKVEPYITLSSAEALAGLAQMGVLEVHPWGS